MTCWRAIASQTNRFTLFFGLLCAVSGIAIAAESRPLVLRGGAVFDPIAGSFQCDQTIVIDGDRIRSVSGLNADLSRGERTVDCRGKYIIPGLIDAHVHLVHLANSSHVVGDQFLPMFLANGVTSVRDAGDPIVAQSVIARSAELRPELCPRVFLASPLIDSDPPIHRDYGYALTDPAKVGPFVDDMVKWNVTTLKIYAGTPRIVGREVIKEGHRAGLRVMAHLGVYSAQDAVLDGVDSLEHIWSVFNYVIPTEAAKQPDHRANLDLHSPQAQSLIAALAKRQVNVDPTLVVFRNMIYLNDMEEIHHHPDLARVPRRMLDYWHSYRRTSNLPLASREARKKEIRKYQELTGLLHRAGVPLLAGTDTPEPFVPPGYSLHQEMEMLVESGLSPAAALAAATIRNAKALNQQDRLGTISPGKLADLVILNADPTIDIRHARQIHAVVRGGLLCDPATVLKAVPTE
jgi:imidazolonepropionase-like amidohydrolase